MSSKRIFASFACGVTALVSLLQPVQACTSLIIPTKDGGYVYGRTLEFALNLDSDIIFIPRGYQMSGTGPDAKPGSGLNYKTKYAVAGANGLKLPIIVDGINEKGLAGGALYLPGFSLYQETSPAEGGSSLASYEALAYMLTNFATVDEVKAGLAKIKVNRAEHPVFKGVVPLHFTLHDVSGKSIVVEYIGGDLQITDNPTHVMTNGPEFGWHLRNLGMYSGVTKNPLTPLSIGGSTYGPPSTGANMIGLPGDLSAPGRFVRAVFFSTSAPTPANNEDGMTMMFHIMNNFDIPPGAISTSAKSASGGGIDGYEITEWTSVATLKDPTFYLRSYDSNQTRKLVLSKMPLDGKEIKTFPLKPGNVFVELQ
jgi:choloylglycine hydrolase